MKIAIIALAFFAEITFAQDIFVAPTGYQPPPKADDILPIAPIRLDERAEMPAQVFTSIDKNDKMEKYERGDGANSKSTVLLADKKGNKAGKHAKKGKVDSKQNVAKLKNQKAGAKVAAKAKPAVKKAVKNAKNKSAPSRQPASKKLPKKKK